MQEEYRELDHPHREGGGRALQAQDSTAISAHVAPSMVDFRDEKDELSLLDLWRILVKRKWTIFTFFFIVLSAVVTATFLTTPVYRASLTLQIEKEPPKVVESGNVIPTESGDDSDFYKTQYELLESRSLVKRVVDQLELNQNAVFAGGEQPPPWAALIDWAKAQFDWDASADPVDSRPPNLVPRFLNALSIEPVHNSRLVKVHFDSPDPQLATQIVNTYADTFINMNLERRFDASAYAKEWLEDQIRQTKAKLEESERQLLEFARREQIINVDDSQPIASQQLEQVTESLARAQERRIEAEAVYRQMQRSGGGLVQILDSPVVQEFKALQAALEAEYQEGLRLYKPAYPRMQALRGRIQQVQSKINAEIGNIRSAVRAQYEAAVANEELIKAQVEAIKGEVMTAQNRSIQYNIFKREVDTNRQLYDGLLQRYKEVGVAGGVGTNNISVIDWAEAPRTPFKPNLQVNVLLAMVLGLMGGVALAFLFEHLDDTIKLPDDFERLMGIPVLGIIPAVKETRGRAEGQSLAMNAHRDPRSAFAEAYRSVRTALQFSTPEGPPRVLSVTSSVAGEGKSTTSLSLAIHFAQAGKQTLLIDADLRNPSLHRNLGLDNNAGLTNYLAGAAKPVDIARAISQIPHLFVIPSGPLPPNPAELLSTPKMVSLLTNASEKFDQVILDCPPVLGLADALILGNMSGGTLLVVEAGSTRRGHVQGALKRLRSARTRVIGGLLAKLSSQSNAYGYQQGYYYYYGQGDDTKRLA